MSHPLGIKCCRMLAILCLGWIPCAFSQFFHQAQVGEVSLSGKSIILNRGMVEGMHRGQRARFYNDEAQMDYIGLGEVIKVNDNYSYWYFRDLPEQLRPKPSQKIFFSLEDELMRGRRPLKIVQTKSVLARDRARNENEDKVPQEMIQKDGEYIEGESAVTTKPSVNFDAKTIGSTQWTGGDIPILSDDYPGELDAVRPQDELVLDDTSEIRQEQKTITAEQIADGAVAKARRAVKRGSEGQIAGHVRGDGSLSDSIPNEFENYQDKVLAQTRLAQETRARVKKNGEMWSAGLTDKELRRTLVESGVIEERERRRRAAANLPSHQVNLRYSTAIVEQTTDIDPNHNGNNFELALGYEYLLENATESLDHFSTELYIERGISYQDIGGSGINGRIAWGALGLQLNWYPYYKPTAIRRFIPFVGLGIKRGNGDMQSSFLQQSYEVQLLGTELHAGLRFRFKAGDEVDNTSSMGMGAFIMVSQESNRFNVSTELQDDIDSVYPINESRYCFGISAFF